MDNIIKKHIRNISDIKLCSLIENCEYKINECNLKIFDKYTSDFNKMIFTEVKDTCSRLLKLYIEEREYRESKKDKIEEWANS